MNSPRLYLLRVFSFERFLIFPGIAMTFFVALALAQSPSQTHTVLDQQRELRRKNFTSGRDLLIQKGVPFDPDELLKDDWSKGMKSVLETMPEMREARYETAPLKGVYFADTFYLPEVVVLAGDTVIVTNHLVFEGVNPIIKGPHALHVFRSLPAVVLGTTVAELMGNP